jgi:RNA polymerase sigma factor (sigma-70 family)
MTVEPSEAFALFYKNNRGPVFRALLARTLDRAAAEDATAEAFARAFAHWHTVADHPNPRAWVLRVAWNYHTSMWRSWDGRRVADPPAATPPAAEQWVDPDLIAAIAGLPDGQREVLVLAALGELRPAEIAKVLGKAASTVRGQLSRARTTLRRALGEPRSPEGHNDD